jgi:hypothetical protein
VLGGDGDITLCFETTQGCPNIDYRLNGGGISGATSMLTEWMYAIGRPLQVSVFCIESAIRGVKGKRFCKSRKCSATFPLL